MGVVYKARDRELDDVVALKVLSPDAAWSGGSVESLREELKLARLITHPNVLRVYDLGDVAGTTFISMEYVAGVTLRQLLDRSPQIPLAAAMRIARQVCAGLAAVHAAGVVHGDLKPENVILDPTGTARLMDFGVSRRRDTVEGSGSKDKVSGTPRYFAPEQIRDGITDPLSDLYTCGVLLFELFTGAFPYPEAKSLALVVRTTLELQPARPRESRAELPEQLEKIILTCLAKERDKRFRSADELLEALESVDLRELRTAAS
jgi:serine/threonine-protein kinase